MSDVHIELLPRRHERDKVYCEAILRDEGVSPSQVKLPAKERFWFAIPESQMDLVSDSAEPFVRALLFALMRRGRPVRVHGHVSPTLLRNLEELMRVWHAWFPDRYVPISIRADDESAEPPPPFDAPAIAAFSGGLDGCYTIWRHTQGLIERRRANLTAALFGGGLDQSNANSDAFVQAQDSIRAMTDSVGLRLLTIQTNYRDIRMNPLHSFGPVIAGCLSLFSKAYPNALFASSAGYSNLVIPHTTSPVTDYLYDGDGFHLVHDGAELIRPEKVRVVANWPEACRHLRVCMKGPVAYQNCGRCEKCIRTIMGFWIHGRPTPAAFPKDPSTMAIASARFDHRVARTGYENVIEHAKANGLGNRIWVHAARFAVMHNRFRTALHVVRNGSRRVRSTFGLIQNPDEVLIRPAGT